MKKTCFTAAVLILMFSACTNTKTYEFEITQEFWEAYRLDWFSDSRLDISVKEMTKEGDVIEIRKIDNLTCDSIGSIVTRQAKPKVDKIMLELVINLNPQGYGGRSYAKKYNGLWKSEKVYLLDTKNTRIDLMSGDFRTYSASIEF